MLRPLSVLLCAALLTVAGCGGGDDDGQPATNQKDASQSAAGEQQGGCKDVEQPRPRVAAGYTKPKRPLDASKTYEVVLDTSCGSFTIRLDQKTSPHATASFV